MPEGPSVVGPGASGQYHQFSPHPSPLPLGGGEGESSPAISLHPRPRRGGEGRGEGEQAARSSGHFTCELLALDQLQPDIAAQPSDRLSRADTEAAIAR